MKTKYILLSTVLLPFMLSGQNKFGNNLGTTSPSAVVEMESPSKGVLLPRVALTGTTDATTITSPATYLTVFNTATASDVTPGYYYWNGTKWIRMLIDSDLGSTAWLLSGNANGALKTIGTTDAYDFPFIVNNTEAMRSIWDATNSTTRVAVGTTKADTVASATSGSTAIRQLSKFTVLGGDAMINHLTVGAGGAQMSSNTAIGYRVLYNNTATGTGNTGIGYLALTANTTGWGNVANGFKALIANTTGWKNTANGCWALYSNTSGADNVATGGQALYSNTTGGFNTATGYNALGLNIDGSNNDAHGYESIGSLTTGERNAGFGIRALSILTSGSYNTGLGCYAGSNLTSGNYNTAVGQGQLFADPTGSYQLNISGAIFGTGLSGSVSAPAGKIGIGLTAPVQTLAVKDSMGISNGTYYNSFNTKSTQAANISYTLPSTKATAAGQVLTNDGTGVLSWAGLGSSAWLLGGNTNGALKTIGTTDAYDFPIMVNNTEAMRVIWDATNSTARVAVGTTTAATVAASTSSSTSSKQLAILTTPTGYDACINDIVIGRGGGQGSSIVYGYQSLYNNTSGSANSSFGDWSLYSNTTGSNNVAMGVITLYKNTTGNSNMALGYGALYNNTTGNNNLSIGYASNRGNTTGTGNVAIGDSTLYNNLALTSGSNNTALGRSAAKICTGSSNIAIGANQGLVNTAGNNQLNIGGAIFGTGLSGSVSAPAGKIGIGLTAPVQTLTVKDSMGISNGTYYNSFNTKSTQAANISYTLPTTKATAAGQVLTNDGNGNLSWTSTTSIVTKTAAYTALTTDETILVNATSAAVTITLPAPVAGKKYIVKKIDTSTNAVTVATTSGTIDGAASISGALSYQGWVFQTNGTNWYVVGRF